MALAREYVASGGGGRSLGGRAGWACPPWRPPSPCRPAIHRQSAFSTAIPPPCRLATRAARPRHADTLANPRYFATVPSLANTLSAVLLRLWPARRHQELLLDLGEHKAWVDGDRDGAVQRLAGWLHLELGIASWIQEAPRQPLESRLPAVPLNDVEPTGGVGRQLVALGHLVGTAPKTLANSLRDGLAPHRRDHRWLALIARAQRGLFCAPVFHARSPANVAESLGGMVGSAMLDAADATLLFGLVALWQRRRPTGEARGARGTALARSRVPKPISSMAGQLLAPGRVAPLLELATGWSPGEGAALAAHVLDAALAEAHLGPHAPRRSPAIEGAEAMSWQASVERALAREALRELLGPIEWGVFRYRASRMWAYHSREPVPLPAEAAAHPHAQLAAAIDAAVRSGSRGTTIRPELAGYLMLVPQARRLGLVLG